jgi:hypothetical protein
MLDSQVLRTKERLVGHRLFLPQEVVRHEIWIGVFKEGTIAYDNPHRKRCSQTLTQMSGCNMLLSRNMWFRVVGIKMKQGLL